LLSLTAALTLLRAPNPFRGNSTSNYWPVSDEEEAGRTIANSSGDEIYEKNSRITWTDHKTNTGIAKELNVTPVKYKIQEYRIHCTSCTMYTACLVLDC
jgi:hypothetical protein